MTRLHPDTTSLLDSQTWIPGFCVLREHEAEETIEAGPGGRICRECLGYRLTLERAYAADLGREYELRLPVLARS